ncbi:MAG: hypothetical protein COA77_02180 [Thaumarchaeota archaeon]|nr:MAG: hypothetical protein COA77_02180 [Nitrososphaerota archaeon]
MSEIKEIKKKLKEMIDEFGVKSKTGSSTDDFSRDLLNRIKQLQKPVISENLTVSSNQNLKKQLLREKLHTLSSQMEQTQQNINKLKKKHALKRRR